MLRHLSGVRSAGQPMGPLPLPYKGDTLSLGMFGDLRQSQNERVFAV
jgi:hypothetical protein